MFNQAVTTEPLGLGAVRAMRARMRRRFAEPRPQTSPEIKQRIGAWKALVEAAQKAGLVSKGVHLYAFDVLKISSVARGDWSIYSDANQGARVNLSARTIRRHRKELVDAGLLESLDGKERHQTCMVRPILPDGPVFSIPNPSKTGRPPRPTVAYELRATGSSSEDSPRPPIEQDNRPEKEGIGPALVAPDVVSEVDLATKPPERRPKESGEGSRTASAAPTFDQFWAATDKAGAESAAAVAWERLSEADRIAIGAAIKREGRLRTGESRVYVWLAKRRWPTLPAPKTREEVARELAERRLIPIRAESPEGYAWLAWWKKYEDPFGLVVSKTGYFVRRFPTRWPPER